MVGGQAGGRLIWLVIWSGRFRLRLNPRGPASCMAFYGGPGGGLRWASLFFFFSPFSFPFFPSLIMITLVLWHAHRRDPAWGVDSSSIFPDFWTRRYYTRLGAWYPGTQRRNTGTREVRNMSTCQHVMGEYHAYSNTGRILFESLQDASIANVTDCVGY
ncbi:hypothetical protein GGR50DRAFT_612301 [Xylaria sp. CBS 124048]|nr:hypothetical protein GGR50DRAFT_612301 [Xylaria sp. CBS 124048]